MARQTLCTPSLEALEPTIGLSRLVPGVKVHQVQTAEAKGPMKDLFNQAYDHSRHRSVDVIPTIITNRLPVRKSSKSLGMADVPANIATNVGLPAAPNRPSPAAQNSHGPSAVPNGKAGLPYAERNTGAQTVSSKDPKAAAQAAIDNRNVVRRKLTGYVGFANLPNQWHRKSVRKGFNFNVMVVGKFELRTKELRR
jgi:hypothetical protein